MQDKKENTEKENLNERIEDIKNTVSEKAEEFAKDAKGKAENFAGKTLDAAEKLLNDVFKKNNLLATFGNNRENRTVFFGNIQ